jgi:hypothetical protein
VIDGVADLRRCIAPDLLCHGLTRERQPPGSPARRRRWVARCAGADCVDLVGNDSGGGIARFCAASNVSVRSPSPIVTSMMAGRRRHSADRAGCPRGGLPGPLQSMREDARMARGRWHRDSSIGRLSDDAARLHRAVLRRQRPRRRPGALLPRHGLPADGRDRAPAATARRPDARRLGHGRRVLRREVGALAVRHDPCCASGRVAGREALLSLRAASSDGTSSHTSPVESSAYSRAFGARPSPTTRDSWITRTCRRSDTRTGSAAMPGASARS